MPTEYEYVGNGNPDGTIFGRTSTELVGFYGTTPVVRRSGSVQAAISTAAVTSVVTTGSALTVYGYTTTAQANAIPVAINALISRQVENTTLCNELRATLAGNGMIAGS